MRGLQVAIDRAAGALVGLAVGDALGAAYEFRTPPSGKAQMIGGGLGDWAPGEWTDDTQMAVCVAEVTATGRLDGAAIGDRFLGWLRSGPPDVGIQTRSVLGSVRSGNELTDAARRYYERHPDHAAGNGSLMRSAPVALAHLGDDEAIISSAQAVSALTHGDPLAGEACALWCIGIDRAVREERLDGVEEAIDLLPEPRRDYWGRKILEVHASEPEAFTRNGFVVTALQAAYGAILNTKDAEDGSAPACLHFQRALHAAVRIGGDTDTVAAIAGELLGARWGVTAVPFAWRRILHGWPGYGLRDLVRLAVLTVQRGKTDSAGWPAAEDLTSHYAVNNPHLPLATPVPDEPGLVIGNVAGLPIAMDEHRVRAVISLCRMGGGEVVPGVEHHEVLLFDKAGRNPNLEFLLCDTAEAIAALRREGKRVFLHCAGGTSRTPTVAGVYLACHLGIPCTEAFERIAEATPVARHNSDFTDALEDLSCCP